MTALGSDIELEDGDARLPVYRSRPVRGAGPGLVLLHDGFGLDACVRETADRLARAGFLVLAPALHDDADTRSPAEAAAWIEQLRPNAAVARIARSIDALLGDPACSGARVGVIGAGAAGELALAAAVDNARVGAVVDFGALPGELELASPAVGAPRILLVFGEDDPAWADVGLPDLTERLRARGFEIALRREPGVGADFTSEARVDRFDARAAAHSWDAALAFLHAAL